MALFINNRNSSTVDLVRENFDNQKLKLYYTEWCGFSKRFMPVWEDLERYLTDNKITLEHEKIDCEKNKEKCSTIEGYPTVILEKDGKEIIMDGTYPRSLDGILKFLKDSGVKE